MVGGDCHWERASTSQIKSRKVITKTSRTGKVSHPKPQHHQKPTFTSLFLLDEDIGIKEKIIRRKTWKISLFLNKNCRLALHYPSRKTYISYKSFSNSGNHTTKSTNNNKKLVGETLTPQKINRSPPEKKNRTATLRGLPVFRRQAPRRVDWVNHPIHSLDLRDPKQKVPSWWLFPNPSEKYDRQIGSISPNFRGENSKACLSCHHPGSFLFCAGTLVEWNGPVVDWWFITVGWSHPSWMKGDYHLGWCNLQPVAVLEEHPKFMDQCKFHIYNLMYTPDMWGIDNLNSHIPEELPFPRLSPQSIKWFTWKWWAFQKNHPFQGLIFRFHVTVPKIKPSSEKGPL